MATRNTGNRYALILERIFQQKYHKGDSEIRFLRSEMVDMAKELSVDLPKNLGDVIYSFRYRVALPDSIYSGPHCQDTERGFEKVELLLSG